MNRTNTLTAQDAHPTKTATTANAENQSIETGLIIQMIKAKSERGFTMLYNNYSGALYYKIMKIVKNTEIAEDLLQDTFVKIWKNINNFDETKGALFTWMINIARNQAIDYLRSSAGKQLVSFRSIELLLPHLDKINNSNSNDYNDIKINSQQIEKKYADVIDMIFVYGFTHRQTAQLLQMPLGTVKTRTRKGLKMLKIIYQHQM